MQGNGEAKEPLCIPRGNFEPREASTNVWQVIAPPGMVLADLEKPQTYTAAPRALRQFDIFRIILQGPKPTWAEVLVTQFIPPSQVQVVVLRSHELPKGIEDQTDLCPPGFDIFRGGPAEGWVIKRVSDGAIMATTQRKPFLLTRRDCVRFVQDLASVRNPARKAAPAHG